MAAGKIRSVFVTTAVLGVFLISTPVMAEKSSKKNFNQPGPYVAVGFGAAFDFLEDVIENEFPILDIDPGWSANVRGGYRVTSWFAVELMYEGVYDLDMNISGVGTLASTDYHGFFVSGKLIAPIGRFQPYSMLGIGTQYSKWSDALDAFNTTRWDFAIRPALGLDIAVTENWAVFTELGLPIRFADWGDIPSQVTDNVTLTVGAGIQCRF